MDDSLEQGIYYFRHCLELLDVDELSKEEYKPYLVGLRLQVYTNYANALEACGRKAAAMKYYRNVLSIDPSFGIAEGNIGRICLSVRSSLFSGTPQYWQIGCRREPGSVLIDTSNFRDNSSNVSVLGLCFSSLSQRLIACLLTMRRFVFHVNSAAF